jgi:hypothetical protein
MKFARASSCSRPFVKPINEYHVSKLSHAMSPTFSKPEEMELVQETTMIENIHCCK